MGPYVYTPVSKLGQIRLIELQPSLDKAADIKCRLIHTSLMEIQDEVIDHYTALSYVWGSPTDRVAISVDGKSLQITRSLEIALIHFRDTTRVFNVWADGICIDQENDEEKSIQVQQMGEVFRTAAHTIIFLGPATELSDMWFKFVVNFPRDSKSQSLLKTVEDDHTVYASLRALDHVLSRPWFYRVWIYQELLLSRDPRIQCGDFRCAWEHFYRAVDFFRENIKEWKGSGIVSSGSETHPPPGSVQIVKSNYILKSMQRGLIEYRARNVQQDIIEAILSKDRAAMPTTAKIPLPNHIENNPAFQPMDDLLKIILPRRGFGVHDPRDMVYAHIGLVKLSGLVPNYTLSVTKVYQDFARAQMEQNKNYDFLFFKEDIDVDTCRPNLRSWAPDWTAENTLDNSIFQTCERLIISTDLAKLVGSESDLISHVREIKKHMEHIWSLSHVWTEQSDLLCSLGFVQYHVTSLHEVIPESYRETSLPNPGLSKLPQDVEALQSQWRDRLTADQSPLLRQQLRRKITFEESLLARWHRHETPREAQDNEKGLLMDALSEPHEASGSVLGRRVAKILEFRPPFDSSGLSLVPASTKVGDIICFLRGYFHPVVVRELKDVPQDMNREVDAHWEAISPGLLQREHIGISHFRIVGVGYVPRRLWNGEDIRDNMFPEFPFRRRMAEVPQSYRNVRLLVFH